ncbi:MAG: mechanosensitive ion channel family protein [Nannocystaceae bacterium]|nr:mechanosensitive ion channel [bacterium]
MPDLVQSVASYLQQNAGYLLSRVAIGLVIIVAAWIASRLARRGVAKLLARSGNQSRARTLTPIAETLVGLAVMGVGIVVGLQQLGLDLTAVIAGAGVLGLAVGFGAQELVRDVISGFFMIFDGVIEAGDFVTGDQATGQVERVGIRVTQIRAFDGTLWYVPNGKLQTVGNNSREWCRAIANVGLAYEQDAAKGLKVLQAIGDAWAKEHPELCVEAPVAQGVVALADSSVNVRLVGKVKAAEHWPIEREWLKRIKAEFDAQDIEIPFPRNVTYLRKDDASTEAS